MASEKVGRPAKYGTPMTSAQRAAEYREKRKELAVSATDCIEDASTQALTDALTMHFAAEFSARESITKIVNELASRYPAA